MRDIDFYGQPVGIKYKGDEVFKTHIGGCISMVFLLGMLIYSGYLFNVMFQRSNIDVTSNTIIRDLTIDNSDHFIGQTNFSVFIGWNGISSPNHLLQEGKVCLIQFLF